jgi:hypothetical protein
MRLFRCLPAAATAALFAGAGAAGAQPTLITFDAVPTASAAGAFATAGGYTFTNFSTLEANSPFGTGSNAVGAAGRFAYVPLGQGFGAVRRETLDFYLQSAFLSYRAFDANVSGPVTVTLNGYRGFDLGSDPVFTRTLTLTNTAQLFDFGGVALSEFEFITAGAELGGRRAVVALDNLTLASVPEPATVVLVGAGVLLVGGLARRRAA